MDWNSLKRRLTRPPGLGRTAAFAPASAVLEIQPDFVAGVRLAGKGKGNGSARASQRVRNIGVVGLEAGTLIPAPNQQNIEKQADLQNALRTVAKVIGNGSWRLALLVPDALVRVAVLTFETLPDNPREADALVRWRMKENVPFLPEEARLSYQVTRRASDQTEVLVIAVKNEVLEEYETALESIHGGSVLALPATIALLPLLPGTGERGQLLIHICSGGITNVIVTGDRLRLWRNRWLGVRSEVTTEQICKEASAEALRILASCRDRLQVETEQVWLCGRPAASPEVRAELARILTREVNLLTPSPDQAVTLSPEDQGLFNNFGAPVVGLMKNSFQ